MKVTATIIKKRSGLILELIYALSLEALADKWSEPAAKFHMLWQEMNQWLSDTLNADGITHANLGPKEQMEYLLRYMRAHRDTILRHQNWYRRLIRRLCFQAASAGLERDFKVMRNLQNPAGVEMRTELQKCAKPKLIKVPDAEYSSREIAHKRITSFLSTFRKNGTPEIWHTKLMEHALSSLGSVGDPSDWPMCILQGAQN